MVLSVHPPGSVTASSYEYFISTLGGTEQGALSIMLRYLHAAHNEFDTIEIDVSEISMLFRCLDAANERASNRASWVGGQSPRPVAMHIILDGSGVGWSTEVKTGEVAVNLGITLHSVVFPNLLLCVGMFFVLYVGSVRAVVLVVCWVALPCLLCCRSLCGRMGAAMQPACMGSRQWG
ncbi:hypothetical protein QBC35DRAFT_489803 [Podospora australis]|uniref:Uncharacterized protein n=1 Tax=Podospora australis TaxID=1536484 RepID=A0AAN6WYB0_9PEZI|nr:hypothetical protein QBC35DRAFT_489803 [Podospora australis]